MAQVEDARQETFVRVLAALKQKRALATPESLGAFVNSVCNNVLLETYRGARRHDQLDDTADGPETPAPSAEWRVLQGEERTRVRAVMADMPEKRALQSVLSCAGCSGSGLSPTISGSTTASHSSAALTR